MLNQTTPIGVSPSGKPIYPNSTIVYVIKNTGQWCPDYQQSQVYTQGQSWQLYHLQCFDHPPSQEEILGAMKQIGCGSSLWDKTAFCNYDPTPREWNISHQHDGYILLGYLGWFFTWYVIGHILGFVILLWLALKVFGVFVRRSAEIRKDVYRGRIIKRRNPFAWGWKFTFIFLILFGIWWYVS